MSKHSTRGTCDNQRCPSHGRCHCCGEPTNTAPRSNRPRGVTKGKPFAYRQGHAPGCKLPNMTPEQYKASGLAAHRGEIPVSKVAPLARWLVEHHGGVRAAERASGIDHKRLGRWCNGQVASVHPRLARRLVQVVMSHRGKWHNIDTESFAPGLHLELRPNLPDPVRARQRKQAARRQRESRQKGAAA